MRISPVPYIKHLMCTTHWYRYTKQEKQEDGTYNRHYFCIYCGRVKIEKDHIRKLP